MGIARTFQNLALFKGMSGAGQHHDRAQPAHEIHLLAQALRLGLGRARGAAAPRGGRAHHRFPRDPGLSQDPGGRLPYGLQKRVDLGRALAMEPKLLLLDEPMAGMNVEEKQDMCRFILDVNDEFGTTIVLIEHDMGVVMDISDRVVVLDYGKKIGDGTPRRSARQPGRDRRLSRREPLKRLRHEKKSQPDHSLRRAGGWSGRAAWSPARAIPVSISRSCSAA